MATFDYLARLSFRRSGVWDHVCPPWSSATSAFPFLISTLESRFFGVFYFLLWENAQGRVWEIRKGEKVKIKILQKEEVALRVRGLISCLLLPDQRAKTEKTTATNIFEVGNWVFPLISINLIQTSVVS